MSRFLLVLIISEVVVRGTMTITGESREIEFPIVLNAGDSLLSIESEFTVRRHDYNMDFGRAMDALIGEEVRVQVRLVARLLN